MQDARQIVTHTEKLARLKIPEEHKEAFSGQIGKILDLVAKLNECDTRDVPPTSHVLPISHVTRPDTLTPSLAREEALALAPDRSGAFYRVPTVIQEA